MNTTQYDYKQRIRQKASFALLVYDLNTGLPMGQILDLSAWGMKIKTEEPSICCYAL